ncbi:MAG: hypothetical protein A2W93_14770 [Bacteroidetes bacterium GWF2_43_63]|nr:MAG: hypothetical protein A2W94_01340 [Bacteroidetes bacterium GWE2_42_42]OFY52602.1 MAG: hypothetical protein A2W93_14770 [Bacteroidetes bacterium GWF2_43_63]
MKYAALIFLLSILLFSCQKEKAGCFSGLGEVVTDTLSIPLGVDNVTAHGRIHVHFIQDSLNIVEVSGGENVVAGIECVFDNNKLRINDNNTCNWVRRLDQVPVVTIHYTTLRYFGAENYYDNLFLKQHQGDTILMEYWTGSGKTKFSGNVEQAYFKVNAGAGGYECAGVSDFLYIYNYGGAKIDCSGLLANNVSVVTGSNNNVYVNCNHSLRGEIRRTGNIYYQGNPLDVQRFGNGSGQLIDGE